MKLQRIFALFKKDIKKMFRESALLFLMLLFPVVLTLAFGFSFGGIGGSQQTTFQIGIVNSNNEQPYPEYAQNFLAGLSHTGILQTQVFPDNQSVQDELVQGKIQAALLIPSNFGESCNSYSTAPGNTSLWLNTTAQLYLDSGSMFATQAIPPVIQQILVTTILGKPPTSQPVPVQIANPSLVEVTKYSTFDFMAPGIFAYASIFLTMTVAQSFTTERENGLLRRINVTPTTATEFMVSQVSSNMVIAIIQAILVFLMAYAVGFRPNVGIESYLLAFAIVTIFSLCNVGFGLITATIAKSSGAATGLSFIFILPQMFLGTFVGAALSSAAQTAGQFVPSYYVTDALTSLLSRKAPITSPIVLFDLGVVAIVSLLVLALGIVLFKRTGKT